MKIVVQRVSEASVTIDDQKVAEIKKGLLILIGIINDDNQEDCNWLVRKIINLRVFTDNQKVMNKSLLDIDGEVIVVSQFTLHASTNKGNRPSYIKAAKSAVAIPLYECFIKTLESAISKKVQTGNFGADMYVALINEGPLTIIIDSKNKK